jgi:putative transposase
MKKSLLHTVWEYKYHVVLVPKKRRKIVYEKLRKEIGLSEYKGVEVIEGKACIDHTTFVWRYRRNIQYQR